MNIAPLKQSKFSSFLRRRAGWAPRTYSFIRNLLEFEIYKVSLNLYLVIYKKSGFALFFPFKQVGANINTQLGFFREKDGFLNHYTEKYLYDNFEIPFDWDVVDCGAYVGGLSLAVARKHQGRIFAIEPSPFNFRALQLNLIAHNSSHFVTAHNYALGAEISSGTLHISVTGQDDSLLSVDEISDDFHSTHLVKIRTFSDFAFAHDLNLDKTFLKIEAEGAELEVLQGMRESLPRVISLDVSAEMYGKSPLPEVLVFLSNNGFMCKPATIGIGGEPISVIAYRNWG
jgi:FkbM family methyltransferase